MGVEVTFATGISAHRRMAKAAGGDTKGLNFVWFSDGYDDGFKMSTDNAKHFVSQIRSCGTECLKEIIHSSAEEGRPISLLVYTLLLPWVAEVARDSHIPSALLWIQPATVLDIYYYYFNGYNEAMSNCNDPSWSIKLPGLPLLHAKDLPSFLLPSSQETYSHALLLFKEQLEALDADAYPKVLVNSFDALEPDALKAIDKLKLIAIGPVIPSAFLDGKDPSDTSFGGDLFQKSRNYSDWLNSKPKESVIYVSFGSLLELTKPQMEEIAIGLIKSNRPFLWVIRKKEDEKVEELSCMEELEQLGMIVPWCSQLEVLSNSALGCFVTHCGWNSTLESLVSGVPVVAFPKWTDQGTNAKLIEDVWRTGVRVKGNEEGFVDGDEISRCLDMVMGGEEYRRNAKKWRDLAREAMKEGGSSEKNLKTFVEEIGSEGLL